jgi:hypothetical protein
MAHLLPITLHTQTISTEEIRKWQELTVEEADSRLSGEGEIEASLYHSLPLRVVVP